MEAQKRKLEEDTQQLERLRMAKEKQFQTYYQVGVFLNCALIHVHIQHLLIYNFCCRIIILQYKENIKKKILICHLVNVKDNLRKIYGC